MSLVAGWFPATVLVMAALALAALVPWEQRVRWRVLGVGLAAAAALTALTVAIVHLLGGLPWPLPWTFDLWFGGVLLGPALAAAGWRSVRWRRVLAPVTLVVTLAAAATLVNQQYAYFPTVGSLFGVTGDATTLHRIQALRAHRARVTKGELVEVAIPGRVSHFDARDAWVWVPPAYLSTPTLKLPVVELLGGSPGDPVDWIRGGNATATADAYAKAHAGIAPVLVMPDENGSFTADTECVDGPGGRAGTYLTVDVPAFMRHTFQTSSGPDSLAVAGFSEGATCSAVLALTHPQEYRAFGDYSGLAAPTVRADVDPARTTQELFHGSAADYAAHDPAHLLRTRHYPGLAGWFEVGAADGSALHAQDALVPLARRAGGRVVAVVDPGGGHDFTLWTQAFRRSLPFLAAHLATPAAV